MTVLLVHALSSVASCGLPREGTAGEGSHFAHSDPASAPRPTGRPGYRDSTTKRSARTYPGRRGGRRREGHQERLPSSHPLPRHDHTTSGYESARRSRDGVGCRFGRSRGRCLGGALCRSSSGGGVVSRRGAGSPTAGSVSPSPCASSASEAASCRSVSLSERMAMVCWRDSRSSTAKSTADGRP
jgi:hypothetical protein